MKSVNETKKILLIFADSSVKKGLADASLLQEMLQRAATQKQLNTQVYITYARSLSFFVSKDNARIYDHANDCDLKEYDFVYFRKAGTVMQQMLACASYLRQHDIPFFDTEIGAATSRNKLSQMFLLQEKGLPVPTTLFCRNRKRTITLLATVYEDAFTWPVIAKATGGTRGDANYLVQTPEALATLMEEVRRHFLIQSFIPNDGDFRVLVIAEKVRGLIKRKGAEGSHLNNTSKQGAADWLPLTTFDSNLQLIAVRAAQVCKRDVAGVDILIDQKTNEPYILEVNRAPQIENATFPEEKAGLLIEGIIEAINEHEMIAPGDDQVVAIGRKEHVGIAEMPALGKVTAKIDTGAYSNSLHCPYVEEVTDAEGRKLLRYSPFADKREVYETDRYFTKTVTSSNGQSEERFVIELHVIIGGRTLRAQISLTDRTNMQYPMLIGRKFLKRYGLTVNVAKRFSL